MRIVDWPTSLVRKKKLGLISLVVVLCLVGMGSAAHANDIAYVADSGGGFGVIDFTARTYTAITTTGVPILSGLGEVGGSLFGGVANSDQLYSINTTTGIATAVGTPPPISSQYFGGFGSTTTGLYVVDQSLNLLSVSTAGTAATVIGPGATAPNRINANIWDLSTGSSTLYYAIGGILYSVDTTTGYFTSLGTMEIVSGGVPPGYPTPSPGTYDTADIGPLVYVNSTLYGADANHNIYSLNTVNGSATYLYNIGAVEPRTIDGLAPYPVSGGGGGGSARLINISTRAQVGTGGSILIPGFVIQGSGTETLLIRGDGPSLTQYGVSGVLAQPSLSVYSGQTVIASNTGWGTNPNPSQIASVAAQVGAFPFLSGSADCAVIVSLPAGAYTVEISGVNNTTGVALAEVYEVSSSGTRLVNISTRAQVGTGGNIEIAGFVISGSGTEQLLVRGDGPSLTQYGVSGVLAQPSLSVFSGQTVIASNTGWGTNANPAQIASVATDVGAFALPSNSADSAVVASLTAGAYTAEVSGVNNTTGVALVEVYEVPDD